MCERSHGQFVQTNRLFFHECVSVLLSFTSDADMTLIHSNASGHLTVRFKISARMRNDNKSPLISSALTTHKSEA